MNIKLGSIPDSHYHDYRLSVMFDGYKWDLQAGDESTISDKVVLLEPSDAQFLAENAVRLYHETVKMEHALRTRPELVRELGISEEMTTALCNSNYDPTAHVRYMRFDFHPTRGGWMISEVNSDVPAGYPEASVLPRLAQGYFGGYSQHGCFGEALAERIKTHVAPGATIAYLYDTHTVEDYQIVHYIGDLMEKSGYKSMYASPEHIIWQDNMAVNADAILRHYPAEWMECTPCVNWQEFVNSQTPSLNHPTALLTQSKRLPIVWDRLGVDVLTWKRLLPETKCASALRNDHGWILKPAFGRVGEGINIPGTTSDEEEQAIRQAASDDPSQWVAQKMFESVPVDGLHLSFGVFVIDGQFAGFFSRGNSKPRMDSDASEMPILVRQQ